MQASDVTLSGKTIWVTRPAQQAQELCRMIERRNGVALSLPTLVIRPLANEVGTGDGRERLARAHIAVFISRNAVVYAARMFPDLVNIMRNKTILAVGQATARCLGEAGLEQVGHVTGGGSEALLQLPPLAANRVRSKRVVILRGRGGRENLREGLLARGATVDYLEVYRRDKPDISRADMIEFWHDRKPDVVVITSLAGLDNMVALTPVEEAQRLLETDMVVMSERIRQHAVEAGFKRIALASDNTDAGLVEALLSFDESAAK